MNNEVKPFNEFSPFELGVIEEIGEGVPSEQANILMQKFGVIPPKLTDKERKFIAREARKNRV